MKWKPVCTFRVDGDPKAQPRARAFARGGKARVYDPGTAEGWKGLVALAAKPYIPAQPIQGPVAVSVTFFFRRPKAHYVANDRSRPLKTKAPVYHTSKPDRDNLEKAVLDALTTVGMWEDDCQVCDGRPPRKLYEKAGYRPGAWITVRRLNGAAMG